jgi:coatomer subunit beta
LDRLIELRENIPNEKVLQELLMDILRVLSATDLEVRKKILTLALDLVSSRNVHEMVMFLKKEIDKSNNETQEDTGPYKQLLVRTLHSATIKFPDVAQQIFPVLMEFLSDENELAASDVLVFVREAIQRLPHLRSIIVHQLVVGLIDYFYLSSYVKEVFPQIRNPNIFRAALWILGEYTDSSESVLKVFELIKNAIGSLPIMDEDENKENADEKKSEKAPTSTKPKANLITADGTYATQSGLVSSVTTSKDDKPILRKLFYEGNFFLASSLATTLNKLFVRFSVINKGLILTD